jgi:TPR repeat protein
MLRTWLAGLALALPIAAAAPAAAQNPADQTPPARESAADLCDRLAADPLDATRPAALTPVPDGLVDAAAASEACRLAAAERPDDPRYPHQAGRALMLGPLDPATAAEARSLLERAAAAGHAAAALRLGELLLEPAPEAAADRLDPDRIDREAPSRALDAFREAKRLGSTEADVAIGRLVESGRLVISDLATAERLYRDAAAAGVASASRALGAIALTGPALRRDYDQARGLLETALRGGDADAGVILAEMAARGLGEPADPAKAERLLRDAVDAGSRLAEAALGRVLAGRSAEEAIMGRDGLQRAARRGDRRAELALLEMTLADPATAASARESALRRLNAFANAGSADAAMLIGEERLRGGDQAGAAAAFALARSLGHPGAAYRILSLDARAPAEREADLRALAVAGDDRAILDLARLLVSQFRGQEAEGWYVIAANANAPGVRRSLADAYLTGSIGRTSNKLGKDWLEKAVQGGDAGARAALGQVLLIEAATTGDYGPARDLFEAAAAEGDLEAVHQLGLMALNGLGRDRDVQAAAAELRKAAEGGHVPSMTTLSSLYLSDTLGLPNAAEAQRWAIRAAEAGDVSSMFSLAVMAAERSPDPAAEAEAVRWLTAAHDKGMPEATMALAMANRYGVGTRKDEARAFALVSGLAATGDFSAQLALARMHELGIGAPRDPALALQLYEDMILRDGTPSAVLGAARLLETGIDGAPQTDRAFEYYVRAQGFELDAGIAAVARFRMTGLSIAAADRSVFANVQRVFEKTAGLTEFRDALQRPLPLAAEAFARIACADRELAADCRAAIAQLEALVENDGAEDARPALARLLREGIGMRADRRRAEVLEAEHLEARRRLILTNQIVEFD